MARKNKEPKEPKAKKVKEPKVKKVKEPKAKKVKKVRQPNMAPNNAAGEKKKYRVIGSPARVLAVAAVISLLLGLFLFKFYYQYYNFVDYVVGGIIALVGIFSLVAYFAKRMIDGVYRNEFAMGIICLGIGGWIILRSGDDYTFFLTVIGLLCALDGVIKLQYTLDLTRMGYKKWWLPLALSVLSIAVGVVILMDLLGGLEWAVKVSYVGLALCANAIFDIVTLVAIALRNRKASKAAEASAEEEGPAVEVEIVEEEELLPVLEEAFPASIPGEEPAAEAVEALVEEAPVEEIPAEEAPAPAEGTPAEAE